MVEFGQYPRQPDGYQAPNDGSYLGYEPPFNEITNTYSMFGVHGKWVQFDGSLPTLVYCPDCDEYEYLTYAADVGKFGLWTCKMCGCKFTVKEVWGETVYERIQA